MLNWVSRFWCVKSRKHVCHSFFCSLIQFHAVFICSRILWQQKILCKHWSWQIEAWIVAKWILCFHSWAKGFIPDKTFLVWKRMRMKEPWSKYRVSTGAIFNVVFSSRNCTAEILQNFEVSPCMCSSVVAFAVAVQQSGFDYSIRRNFLQSHLQTTVEDCCYRKGSY